MPKKLFSGLFPKDLPNWFLVINSLIYIPIFLWPFISFFSIFIFDSPKSGGLEVIIFLLINSYPIFNVIIAKLNISLFRKNRYKGLIIPAIIFITLLFSLFKIYSIMKTDEIENKKIEEARKKAGWLSRCDTYKVLDNKLYYIDTPILNTDISTFEEIDCITAKDKNRIYYRSKVLENSDSKTFEEIDNRWQKDKNNIYYDFVKIENLDRASFKLLNSIYAVDSRKVYCKGKILQGADPNTFRVVPNTTDGRDDFSCYRIDTQINCLYIYKNEK